MSDIYVYKNNLWKPVYDFRYTGSAEKFTLPAGKYLFICNGANGGVCIDAPSVNEAPHGGTSYGILDLNKTSDFYAVVGGNGGNGTFNTRGSAGYNGGGLGGLPIAPYSYGAGGGGASDVRLKPLDYEEYVDITYTVPEEYQCIEYIASMNYGYQQWIDTQYIHKPSTRIECDFMAYDGKEISAIPSMVSNTLPYGEVISSGYFSDRYPYKAFDGVDSLSLLTNCWTDNTNVIDGSYDACYVGYIFKEETSIGYVSVSFFCDTEYTAVVQAKINGNWVNIVENIKPLTSGYSRWQYGVDPKITCTAVRCCIIESPSDKPYFGNENYGGNICEFIVNDHYEPNPVYILNDWEAVYGARNDTYQRNAFIFFSRSNNSNVPIYNRTGAETQGTYMLYNNRVHTVAEGTSFTIYTPNSPVPISTITTTGTNDSGVSSMLLFDLNRSSSAKTNFRNRSNFTGRMYYWKVYEDNELKHFFVPVKRKVNNEITLDSDSFEVGTINSSGDYNDNTRIRLKYFLRADDFGSGVSLYATDNEDVELQMCVAEYYLDDRSSTNLIDDGDWKSYGGGVSFNEYTSYFRVVIKYPNGKTINPSNIKTCRIVGRSVGYARGGGMFDLITQKFHSNRCINYPFEYGPETEQSSYIERTIYDSNYSRIIVAGGGGGAPATDSSTGRPTYFGMGGGAIGGPVSTNISDPNNGLFADQTSGYSFGTGMTPSPKTGDFYWWGCEGGGGGGGGWYGGYAVISPSMADSSSNGGGGSSYVLTESSYKPTGYGSMISEDYYFTDVCMTGGTADTSSIMILKQTQLYSDGDKLIFPCVGWTENIDLKLGEYVIKCWGGDGGSRYDLNTCARGGYAEGTLTLDDTTSIFVTVGGSGIRSTFDYQSTMMCTPTLSFNGGGSAGSLDDILSTFGGGATDVRLIENTLNNRLIVAGGAGGQGSPNLFGGAGGGETGGGTSGGYGYTPGPGTQTSSPEDTSGAGVGGGFGFGGSGSVRSNGYGGAGGGGWYGGSGTYPDYSSDDDRGGCGGSGYVLTESSYKPTGYALDDPSYYLSNISMVTGDTSHRYGQTKAEIIVNNVMSNRLLCVDEEGTKWFNNATEEWEYIFSRIPTVEDFKTYGSFKFTTDTGLLNNYTVYIFDEVDAGINLAILNIIPPKQNIVAVEYTENIITDTIMDADIDEELIDVSISSVRKGVAENSRIEMTISVDIKDISEIPPKFYSVLAYTQGNVGSYVDPRPKPPPLPEQYLLPVGIGNRMPSRYKSYLGGFLDDGHEAISTINSTASAECNRNIYTIALCNNRIVRFTKLNLITNTSTIIRDVPKSLLGNTYYGGMVVDDDYMYIASSSVNSFYQIWRIPIDPNDDDIQTFVTPKTARAGIGSYGKLEWYDSHTIIMTYYQGLWLFDTRTLKWTDKQYYTGSDGSNRGDFAVGKRYLLSTLDSTSNSSLIIDVKNNQWYSLTNQIGYTLSNTARNCVCYGNGKFYIAQTGYIYILDEEELYNKINNDIPVNVIRIAASYLTSVPRTIDYTEGMLYITLQGSPLLYIYDINNDRFTSTVLQFDMQNWGNADNFYRPTTLNGYYFIGNIRLFAINFGDYVKYNMGYKYDQMQIVLNNENISKFTYDDRFVTFKDSYMTVTDGDISKPLTNSDPINNIYTVDISKSEYNKLLSLMVISETQEEGG